MRIHHYLVAAVVFAACTSSSTSPPTPSGDDAQDAGPTDAPFEHPVKPPDPDTGVDAGITGPDRLSQTGLYSDFPSRAIAPGILEYVPRWQLWSDGATKRRFLSLPPNATIDSSDMDNWVFPVGTRVWKEFHVGGVLVETRLLQKVQPGATGWWEVAYVWLADGSDAIATPAGVKNALGTTHDVPSQIECNKCHGETLDVLLGIGVFQLGASDGDGTLAKLVAAGALSAAPSKSAYDVPGAGTIKDALGYLHGNCGPCHNRVSLLQGQSKIKLRVRVADADPQSTDTYTTTIGTQMIHQFPTDAGTISVGVIPGDPDHSELWWRMNQRGLLQMPPVCTKVVDTTGTQTIHDWIAQMDQ